MQHIDIIELEELTIFSSGKLCTETHLLHLELDGGLDLIDLRGHGLSVGEDGGEFTSLVQTGSQDTGNLLDQGIRGEETIVLLSQFLDQLLVLVELLQSLDVHTGQVVSLSLITMLLISQDTDF